MSVIPEMVGSLNKAKNYNPGQSAQKMRPYHQNNQRKEAVGVAQAVAILPWR
jgi:hypothetical protein